MKPVTREPHSIALLAEQQIRRWVVRDEVMERQKNLATADTLHHHLGPYLCLSREAGAGGAKIAGLLGKKIGWGVIDRELLDYMAEKYHLPRSLLEIVDETTANWIHEVVGSFAEQRTVTQTAYVSWLGKFATLAAYEGKKIFVGRGVQFFLPPEAGLRVRLVAPLPYRIEQMMERCQLSSNEAKQKIRVIDQGRNDFIRQYFHHDARDASLYDLVLNVASLGETFSVDLIAESLSRRLDPRFGSVSVAVSAH